MKPYPVLRALLIAASLSFVSIGRADDSAYVQVIKKREAVLSEILSVREAKFAAGACDEAAVFSARLALLTFRRNVAPTVAGKISQQEVIEHILAEELAVLERQSTGGTGDREGLLVAREALLQADQLLEELRLQLKNSQSER